MRKYLQHHDDYWMELASLYMKRSDRLIHPLPASNQKVFWQEAHCEAHSALRFFMPVL